MRASIDEYFIQLALHVATRSTCRHRQQGAVIAWENRVMSTGYNGAPAGMDHCIDRKSCNKDVGRLCRAEGLHGESNAIATAARLGIPVEGSTMYTVYSPCLACCNLLATAGIDEVKYKEIYESYIGGPDYLSNLGIKVEQVTL